MSIIADHLSYIYSGGTAYEVKALDDVSFKIEDGEYVGLLGHTGSGKSTLVQLLDGLLSPSSGTVYIDGEDIFDKDYQLKSLRGKVGIVFQYPEYQLFEADVFTDAVLVGFDVCSLCHLISMVTDDDPGPLFIGRRSLVRQ